MIITKLIGGLGNQMFQYAMARALAQKLGYELKLDISAYKNQQNVTYRSYELGDFNIQENFSTEQEINNLKFSKSKIPTILRKLFNIPKHKKAESYAIETQFHFDPLMLNLKNPVYLEGCWQSEKYFNDIEDILKKEFTLKIELDDKNKDILKEIESSNSISIHLRRGDYVLNKETNDFHGVCNIDYYKKTIEYISQQTSAPYFFIFSDEPEWVYDNFKLDNKSFIIDNNKAKGIYDLILMKSCKHNIIANSTFSWWAAWLNNNRSKIVIAPQKWFNKSGINTDYLLPDNWIKI